MIPAAFGYTRAGSVDDALGALAGDDGAKVIAGGQSLLPLLKLRLASAETLVDIGRLVELRGIERLDDGRLSIGALTTYAELMDSPAIHYGVLRDALPTIGDVQVRNRGTVGGAVAHADPASDLPAVAARARTRRSCSSPSGGTRTRQGRRVLRGAVHDRDAPRRAADPRDPARPPRDEAGVRVRLARAAGLRLRDGRRRGGRRSSAPANVIEWAGIGVTGVGDHPYRATDGRGGADRAPTDPRTTIAAAAAKVVGEPGGQLRTSTPRPSTARRWRSCTRDGRSRRRWPDWAERRRNGADRGVRLERLVPGRRPPAGPARGRPRARPARRRRRAGPRAGASTPRTSTRSRRRRPRRSAPTR